MADANLLEILDIESKLDNMVVYGNIRCAISKPKYLSDRTSVVSGFFALVDVLALCCNGTDYFSQHSDYRDSKHIYFSKGSMVVVIDDKSLIGRNVRVYGRTMKGCTIKKQNTPNYKDGISAFAWTKTNSGWAIVPNKVIPLGVGDVKGTILEDYIVNLVSFKHPSSIESIAEYSGVENAEIIEDTKIVGGLEYSTEPVDLTKIPMNLVYRLNVDEESDATEEVGETVKELNKKSTSYTQGVVSDVKRQVKEEFSGEDGELDEDVEDIAVKIVTGFVSAIGNRYNVNLPNTKTKGKDFVDNLLDDMFSVSFRKANEDDEDDKNMDSFKEVENIKKNIQLDANAISPYNVKIPLLRDMYKYATLVVGCVTGIGVSDMVSAFNSANRYNELKLDEWFWCLIRNPYLCGMLSSGLSVCDCDKIFFSFADPQDVDWCMEYRDMMLVLDTIKNASSRSTLIPMRDIFNPYNVYPALGRRYIEENGVPFKRDAIVAIELMTNVKVVGDNDILRRDVYVKGTLNSLINLGLVEEVNGDYILASDLYKEYIIYSKLIEKGIAETRIKDDAIEKTIDKFQKDRGFNLEVLQAKAIQLVKQKAGVLSGCAGSGKTTTSDCMVMAIEDYMSDYSLRFGAPTGKAARRLAEVVGGNVKTIHSMFGLGLGGQPYLRQGIFERRKNDEGVKYAYFLDEMAMCNTNLMYEIVNHLNDDDLVYFLGDIKQLSPIGKGSPFRALMKFLPCVELGVSKSAAANGEINYNCGLINFVSDDSVVELQTGDDFDILPCSDVDIQRETVNSFREMLSEYSEDDIQVVTGYQTDKYPWATVNLNPLLQGILRKEEEFMFNYGDFRFMLNDRVIHVKRNAYDMPRFRVKQGGLLEEVVTFGMVNGELGKLVGYIKSEECHIVKYQFPSDEELKEMDSNMKELVAKRENAELRDESIVKDESTYFVVVQVYDVDLKEDVVVLYRAHNKSDDYGRTFTGGDLRYLDLAYALTTHKMQGSQSPCIIIPLGSKSSASFMNRNMINTMITRAQKKVRLIGSVRGRNSALTNGRRNTNIDEGNDVLGLLC